MDKHRILNFNDSRVCSLWELFQYSFEFMDSVKAQVQIPYVGLRFFGSILRKPEEKANELIEKIGALICQAGIIICSLYMDKVKDREHNSLQVRDATDCYATLVNTKSAIKLIMEQISGSSMIGEQHSFGHWTLLFIISSSDLKFVLGALVISMLLLWLLAV
ncbi:hypothetical protein ACH5RR_028442 [Cinchona calisaya]|uniref:Uncharacterized protein n=1 Tax=Cinchona calisaya TaxID=153742 RepID=A0ABD2YQ64_9GENT